MMVGGGEMKTRGLFPQPESKMRPAGSLSHQAGLEKEAQRQCVFTQIGFPNLRDYSEAR